MRILSLRWISTSCWVWLSKNFALVLPPFYELQEAAGASMFIMKESYPKMGSSTKRQTWETWISSDLKWKRVFRLLIHCCKYNFEYDSCGVLFIYKWRLKSPFGLWLQTGHFFSFQKWFVQSSQKECPQVSAILPLPTGLTHTTQSS